MYLDINYILDDGMKDNILYVFVGLKVDEKFVVVVYVVVNKKVLESNNNVNIYVEVNKSGYIIVEGVMCGDVKLKKGILLVWYKIILMLWIKVGVCLILWSMCYCVDIIGFIFIKIFM